MRPYRIIIAGSRTITDYPLLEKEMNQFITDIDVSLFDVEIVSGTARGVDKLGEQWAATHKLPVKRFPADWDRYGRSAGFRRNEEMAEYATHLVAFWDGESRGTMNMINLGRRYGLKVQVVRPGPLSIRPFPWHTHFSKRTRITHRGE